MKLIENNDYRCGAKSKKLADDLCQQGYDAYSIEGGFYSILHQKT